MRMHMIAEKEIMMASDIRNKLKVFSRGGICDRNCNVWKFLTLLIDLFDFIA